jgi:radical SAM superfamily enzyme YgiQ (UPF0313 family)
MWVLDPVNSPSLIASLRPHSIAPDFEVVFVGEGWRELVEECHQRLASEFPKYRFDAIEQKFGVLAYQATLQGGSGGETGGRRETSPNEPHQRGHDGAERRHAAPSPASRYGRIVW